MRSLGAAAPTSLSPCTACPSRQPTNCPTSLPLSLQSFTAQPSTASATRAPSPHVLFTQSILNDRNSSFLRSPTEYKVGDLGAGAASLQPELSPCTLYLGGDVGQESVHLLHGVWGLQHSAEVIPGVFVSCACCCCVAHDHLLLLVLAAC